MASLQGLTTRRPFHFLIFILVLISLCLMAIQPFASGRMPQTADGLLQMYRTVALEHSLRVDDTLWPRYSSGLVYGYGAPLFNFFPPLSYYPTTWLHALGLDFVGSWLLTMAGYTVLAALGMFLLARHWTGSALGGWTAALAYVYAPYFLFDSLARGSSPELAALAAMPFVMLGFTRLAFGGRRRDFALAVVAFSVFIPLHTLITLHGTIVLALYCVLLSLIAADSRAVFARLLLAGLLALLLTAFYWLPALLETDAIKLNLINEQLRDIDVTRHLRPLTEILALPHTADPTQQNQAAPISLGWPQLLVSAVGMLLCTRRAFAQFRPLLFALAIVVVVMVFMNMPHSAVLWQTLPLIGYTQFPWRLLGLASLLLALMTGISVWLIYSSLSAGRTRTLLTGGVTTLMLVYAIPWTYTAFHDEFSVRDIRDAQQFERQGGQLALSSYAEYLPVSADAGYLDAQQLAQRFAVGEAIPRLTDSDTLGIVSQQWRGTSAALRLRSLEEGTLVFDWLYVPGWRADIDGRAIDVFPSQPAGLVALKAPAGEFDLRVSLGATTIQSVSHVLSALGVIGLLVAWRALPGGTGEGRGSGTIDLQLLAAFAALGIGVFLVKVAALDTTDTPFMERRFGAEVNAPAVANFGNQIDLLRAEIPSGAIDKTSIEIRLYWRLHGEKLDRDFTSIVRMRDPWGHVVAESSSFAPGGLATRNWLPKAYVEDVITLDIPPFTPPLDQAYSLDVALFDAETLVSLSVINEAGNPQDVKYPLGDLLYRPSEQARLAERQGIRAEVEGAAAPAVLQAAPDLPAATTVGDELQFSWTWQKIAESATDLMAMLVWQDERKRARFTSASAPLVKGYGFQRWTLGEVNRGYVSAIVPPDLFAGRYRVAVQLLDAEGNLLGDVMTLDATMDIAVPMRRFAQPESANAVDAKWLNGVLLHGYSASEDGQLAFVWGTERQLLESLRLFVHVLDADDLIVAQWDGVPVDWTRPTTGWLPGEYLETEHQFELPAGEYRARVGWYEPLTGERVGMGEADVMLLEGALTIEED